MLKIGVQVKTSGDIEWGAVTPQYWGRGLESGGMACLNPMTSTVVMWIQL